MRIAIFTRLPAVLQGITPIIRERGHEVVIGSQLAPHLVEAQVGAGDALPGQGGREIPAPEQRALPVRRFLGIAIRRGVTERRVPEALQVFHE